MKAILKYILLTICTLTISSVRATTYTPEDFCDIRRSAPQGIKDMRPMPDGESYACLGDNGRSIEIYSYKDGKHLSTLFSLDAIKGEIKISEFNGYRISANGKKILLWNDKEGIYRYSFKAQYYVYDVARSTLKRVSANGRQRGATLSHDGSRVAFMRDNDIYITNLDYDTETRVTTTGKTNEIINGTPDWCYEEEFGILNTMRWSPDDSTLAFIVFDETKVPQYHFDIYSGYCDPIEEYATYPGEFVYKYPLPGCPNSIVSVKCYNVDTRITKEMQIPMTETDYIPSMEFGGSSDRLMVMVLNRDQNNLNLYNVNPGSTVAHLVLNEKSSAWLSPAAYQMVDYSANSFVIGSDRTGYRHLYKYDYTGKLIKNITSGNFYVTAYYGESPLGEYYFQGTMLGAVNRNVAKVSPKGVTTMLNPVEGTESASFSTGFKYYVRTYSNITTPPVYTLNSAKGKISDLMTNQQYAEKYADAPKKELLKVPNATGEEMDAYIIKPSNFDPNTKYPLLMYQYNGPESQQVLNRWQLDGLYYLADKGYIIACVDGRGTGCRSRSWSDAVYCNLGKYETEDQLAGARYFANLPYVDATKTACFGWSFGGYMTLMELTSPDNQFKAGIAMAAVTDWKYYDSIYTERYMLTPEQNPTGYETSSTLPRTSNLNVPLLIMSGTADDNVHFYNTLKYTSKLTSEGTLFDMVAWTGFEHSLRMCNARVQLYSKVLDFLNTRIK